MDMCLCMCARLRQSCRRRYQLSPVDDDIAYHRHHSRHQTPQVSTHVTVTLSAYNLSFANKQHYGVLYLVSLSACLPFVCPVRVANCAS